jgi:hypothetical protein
MIAKRRILQVVADIVYFVSSLQPYSYKAVLKLDSDLSDAHSRILPLACDDDPTSLLAQKKSLEFLYHKGRCILHRKLLVHGRLNNRFAFSRSNCIKSAVALLSQQNLLYEEAKLKGILNLKN